MKAGHRVIGFSMALCVANWVLDAFLDAVYYYSDMPFFDLFILRVPGHELSMRITESAFIIGFGVIMARVIEKRIRAEEGLQAAKEELEMRVAQRTRDLWKANDQLGQELTARSASETRYRGLIEDMPAMVCRFLPDGTLTFVNNGYCSCFKKNREELMGKNFFEFIPEEDRETVRKSYLSLTRDNPTITYEHQASSTEGKIQWQEWTDRALFDDSGAIVEFQSIGRDTTERKLMIENLQESERRLRHLSAQLLTAQETERKRISMELHDELGQALTLVKLKLNYIMNATGKDEKLAKVGCEDALDYIDQVIGYVRRLSRDLAPLILEDMGLTAAMRRLVQSFVRNYDFELHSHIMDVDDLSPKDVRIMVYRILQECLTNVVKHAGARNVSVVIRNLDDSISLFVEDDGRGFDVTRAGMRDGADKGSGLAILEERTRMLGGVISIWSERGKGTQVAVTVPKRAGVKLLTSS